MSWPDLVNGSLELVGALLLMSNVVAIRESKCLKGVRWYPVAFFSAWGFWNLFFYRHLDQWLSFIGACCMVLANTLWLAHVGYYWWTGVTDDAGGVQDSTD
jgi:hypothetical protein